ncbi:MAG: hydrogenase maturation protease [Mycobacterium sp.]|nr:hydrogenase maturation protease [Mycobacterium sp.]
MAGSGTVGGTVVVGLGNRYRRDDGVGPAAAAGLDDLALPHVRVVTGIAEPMGLLEAWTGAGLAVMLDAAVAAPSVPGRIRRCTLQDLEDPGGTGAALSSHRVGIGRAHALARALGRAPDALVVFTVDVSDTGHGIGLTPPVAAAVPTVLEMVVAEINRVGRPPRRSPRRASR